MAKRQPAERQALVTALSEQIAAMERRVTSAGARAPGKPSAAGGPAEDGGVSDGAGGLRDEAGDGVRDGGVSDGRSEDGGVRKAGAAGDSPELRTMRTRANDICLGQLAAAARTRHQLLGALARKDIPTEIAAATVDRLTDLGLVDDACYARAFVTAGQGRRGLSKQGLRQQLRQRGVASHHIDQALADLDADSEFHAAVEFVRKRAPGALARGASTARRRLLGLLHRRGYGPGLAARAVSAVLQECGSGQELTEND